MFASLKSKVSLFKKSELDASCGEEGDNGLLSFSDDEDVVSSGGECVTSGVLYVGDVEAAGVLFNVLEDTYSTDVVTTNNQNLSSVFVLDESLNFSSLKIQLQLKRDI